MTTQLVNVRVKCTGTNLKQWVSNPNHVYIGRGRIVIIDKRRYPENDSKYANPYKVGRDGSLAEVLEKYESYARSSLTREDILALRRKTLGCWCVKHPISITDTTLEISEMECHGQILMKLLEEIEQGHTDIYGPLPHPPVI